MAVSAEDVIAAVQDGSEAGVEAIKSWLALRPEFQEVVLVAKAIPARNARQAPKAFGGWARERRDSERTDLLLSLWEAGVTHHEWIRLLHRNGLEEERVVEFLISATLAAPRGEDREELIDRLIALAPHEPRSQRRVGGLVVELLSTGKKVDFNLALRAFPALGTRHQSKTRIEAALREATEKLGEKLSRYQIGSVEAAGIRPPKKTFTDRAWRLWKDLTS